MSLVIMVMTISIGLKSKVAVTQAPRHRLSSSEAPKMKTKMTDKVAKSGARSRKRKRPAFWTTHRTISSVMMTLVEGMCLPLRYRKATREKPRTN